MDLRVENDKELHLESQRLAIVIEGNLKDAAVAPLEKLGENDMKSHISLLSSREMK